MTHVDLSRIIDVGINSSLEDVLKKKRETKVSWRTRRTKAGSATNLEMLRLGVLFLQELGEEDVLWTEKEEMSDERATLRRVETRRTRKAGM